MRKLYACSTSSLPASDGRMSVCSLSPWRSLVDVPARRRPVSRPSGPSIPTNPARHRPIPTDRRTGWTCPQPATWCSSAIRTADPAAGTRSRTPFCRLFRTAATRSSATSPATCSTPSRSGPTCCANPVHEFALRRLERGLRTDILGIHFQGNGDRLHPRSMDVAEELLAWLAGQSPRSIKVIGHANGADGRRSRAFYRKDQRTPGHRPSSTGSCDTALTATASKSGAVALRPCSCRPRLRVAARSQPPRRNRGPVPLRTPLVPAAVGGRTFVG